MSIPDFTKEQILKKMPVFSVASIVASLLYALLTTGYIATKSDVVNATEVGRNERLEYSVSKDDYKSDIADIKQMLNQLYAKVEETRLENARRR